MKRFCLLLIVVALPILTSASDNEQPVESSIEEVTVFRNGAQLTRQATVTLSPGRNEILLKGLSPSLNARTIQLSGDGSFTILSLTHRQDYLDEHPQKERLQQLITRRDSLQRLIEDKETGKSVLDRELKILMSNSNLKGDQQNLSATELEQAMEYFHEKLSELESQKLNLSREITALQEELKKVKQQIEELDNNASQNSSVITAVLQSESEQQVQLSLSYLVSSAGWNPSYDLRVSDTDSPVNLSYKANVYQSTGVDWNDVPLEVSSAQPNQSSVLPQLEPWYIRFYEPRGEAMQLRSARSADQMSVGADQKDERQQQMPEVQQMQNQTSFSYRIKSPYDVPSGGKPLAVEINRAEIPANYQYFAVPKKRNAAFLTARISDWGQYNLLPGQANLFFENTYVGKSSINPRAVGDTLSFSLGKDESIVVEREKLREFEEKNFFGGKVRETFAWEISVRNSKDKSIRIEVTDQLPVSQHEDISVSLEKASGADYNDETGKLTWQLQLDSGETERLRFEFEVEYPRGKEVNL